MRGELCVGSASVLSLVALLLLIFMHVGQINTSTVLEAYLWLTCLSYGNGLSAAIGDPVAGLYTSNASAPLEEHLGLRQIYKFGLYSHCAFVNTSGGICSNHSTANRFEPFTVITADMLTNYSSLTTALVTNVTIIDSPYLGEFTNGAYYLILIGTVCAALTLFTGLLKHTFLFLLSTAFAVIGSLTLLIGATIWTVIIKKTESINDFIVGPSTSPAPLGIIVTTGNALFLLWAAFACLIVSILPYMISCCTYRG
ncbi:hypothetical protein A0H81_00472 [Grifola frondosa]|uniref:Uncharacterized protein n=1 Tax=Grifola frondosa TaxID=5627 RepID=A0A1C7MVJ9_GRIFR|nr:hypothetical protein A0H81_00472 [Grifola frondosa]